MLPNLSAQSHPWLLLLMPVFALLLAPLLWVALVYAIGRRLRENDPHRLKVSIALTIVAAILPFLWVRGWNDLALFGAMSVIFATITFGILYVMPRARQAPPSSIGRERSDGLREICLSIVASAFAVFLASAVANTVQLNTHSTNLALNFIPLALTVWQSGFWLGRASLHLRRRVDGGTPLRGEA
jgi:hypothetical protein